MAIPTDEPTWATDGGAEVTDPGDSKQATGFITAEAPAAGHHNWLLNNHGAWLNFLRESMAATIFRASAVWTPTIAGDGGGFTYSLNYLPDFGRYYVNIDKGGNSDAYDSVDGETWSAQKDISDNGTAIGTAQFFEKPGDAVYCVFGSQKIWRSTTGLVANLTQQSPTFTEISAGLTQGLYHSGSDKFFAFGNDGIGDISIESADTIGGTWTVEYSPAITGTAAGVATSGASMVANMNNDPTYHYATDPTGAWSQAATLGANLRSVVYNAATGRFWFTTGGGVAWAPEATPGAWVDTAVAYEGNPFVFPTDFGMMVWDDDMFTNDRWIIDLYTGAGEFMQKTRWEIYNANGDPDAFLGNGGPAQYNIDTQGNPGRTLWTWQGNKVAYADY